MKKAHKNQFAKTFWVGDPPDLHQVLITIDYNDIDYTYNVIARIDYDGATMNQTLGGYETIESATEAFEKAEQEYADTIFTTAKSLLE